MRTPDFPFDFELDPYEQALDDEWSRLYTEGSLVNTLTPARKKEIQQAAANTLQLLREGKRWIVEHHSTSDSSEELMNWLSPAAQATLKKSLRKKTASMELAPA